ncbi:MAG TPA: sulfatase-like hydrolase/transferase [Flavitalea sp.]|nr:sulfatase-like hydrolase/transferase [Flavitalea sp.]
MRIFSTLQAFPYHVAGIILFFLTHGYSEYPRLVPLADLFLYFFSMLIVATAFMFIFFKLTGSYHKAGLLTSYILLVYLFFGAILDAFKYSGWLHPLSRYSILLPGLFLLFLAGYFLIKRSRRNFRKLTLYLNTFCILIVVFDLVNIGLRLGKSERTTQQEETVDAAVCIGCQKPDIYLVVIDEYCGSSSLKSYFNYDNSRFETFLRNRGFFVATRPTSNYMATSLSMASTFDMNYLSWTSAGKKIQVEDYSRAEETITNSNLIKYLTDLNYEVENYSIFKINNQPSRFNTGLLPSELELITFKTLFNRMNKDLVWHLHQKAAPRFRWLANHFQNNFREGNHTLLELTTKALQVKSERPRFIYTHLMMPHYPCLYDSIGREANTNFYDPRISKKELDEAYLQYLVYTNKVVSTLVEDIQDKTANKAVISVMSDHGYRGINVKTENAWSNNNFLSVYLPSGKYEKFYSSISNVNFFRCVINSLFDENLPRLKDSIVN